MGYITLIMGPMFAGKTTELIRRIRRLQISNYKCIILKSHIDIRSDAVETHDGLSIACEQFNFKKDYSTYDVIAIDEGQFINELYDFCELYNDKKNLKIVINP